LIQVNFGAGMPQWQRGHQKLDNIKERMIQYIKSKKEGNKDLKQILLSPFESYNTSAPRIIVGRKSNMDESQTPHVSPSTFK